MKRMSKMKVMQITLKCKRRTDSIIVIIWMNTLCTASMLSWHLELSFLCIVNVQCYFLIDVALLIGFDIDIQFNRAFFKSICHLSGTTWTLIHCILFLVKHRIRSRLPTMIINKNLSNGRYLFHNKQFHNVNG